MEILSIRKGHPLWEKTICFARNSSWRAGPFLAGKMESDDFLDWERVVVAVEEERIVGYCTVTEKDELPEKYGYSPFIGFVFVDEKHRGKRISERLIGQAVICAREAGYSKIYLMSGEKGLYEKYGFEKIGDYETIFGTMDQLFEKEI